MRPFYPKPREQRDANAHPLSTQFPALGFRVVYPQIPLSRGTYVNRRPAIRMLRFGVLFLIGMSLEPDRTWNYLQGVAQLVQALRFNVP